MTDIASLNIAIDATSADRATTSLNKLDTASIAVQKSTDGIKTSSSSAWATMNTMSAAEDAAADKAWALANGYSEVDGKIVKLAVETEKATVMTAKARQEFVVLGRELAQGNISRVPGTFSILATQMPVLIPILAGVTAAIGVGAAVFEVFYSNVDHTAESMRNFEKSMEFANLSTLQKNYDDLGAKVDSLKEKITKGWFFQSNNINEMQAYRAEMAKLGVQMDKLKAGAWENDAIASALTSPASKLQGLKDELSLQERLYITLDSTGSLAVASLSKQKQLKEEIAKIEEGPKKKIDPNDTAVLQLQNEQFKKQMELLGATSEQVKFLELAMKGATVAQINQAQAAADSISKSNSEIKSIKDHVAAEKEWQTIVGNTDPIAKAGQEWENLLRLQKELGLSDKQITDAYQAMVMKNDKTAKEMSKAWETFAKDTQRTMGDVLFNGMTGKYTDIEKMFSDMLLRMIANATAARLSEAIFGTNGQSGSSSNGWIGAALMAFGGGKAVGGPVNSGTTYLVGEKGPELFTPGASGNITPNSAMGGTTMNNNYVINVDSRADRQQTIQEMSKMIDNKQAQQEDRLRRMGAITA
jgi:hypothetical protein